MNPGCQLVAGETIEAIPGEVTHPDLSETPIDDDGIDLMDLRPTDASVSLSVLKGENTQAAVLNGGFADIPISPLAVRRTLTL